MCRSTGDRPQLLGTAQVVPWSVEGDTTFPKLDTSLPWDDTECAWGHKTHLDDATVCLGGLWGASALVGHCGHE